MSREFEDHMNEVRLAYERLQAENERLNKELASLKARHEEDANRAIAESG